MTAPRARSDFDDRGPADEARTALAELNARKALEAFAEAAAGTPEFLRRKLDASHDAVVLFALERTLAFLREPWLRFGYLCRDDRSRLARFRFDHELETARDLAADLGPPLALDLPGGRLAAFPGWRGKADF